MPIKSGARKEDQLLDPKTRTPEPAPSEKASLKILLDALRFALAEDTPFSGFSAGSINANSLKSPLDQAPIGFPFRTKSAEKVWVALQGLVKLYPKAPENALIASAIDQAQVISTELTPEDGRMLEIATNWLLTNRLSTLPPVDSRLRNPLQPPQVNRDAQYLAKRGAT